MTENPKRNPKEYDADTRLPVGLCPPILTIRVAAIMRWGANKVGRWRWNWRDNPVSLTTYLDAIERHLLAARAGEEFDAETGESHVAHIAANCGIILDAQLAGTLVNDLPKNNPSVAPILKEYSDRFRAQLGVPGPAELEQRAQAAMKALTQLEEHRGLILKDAKLEELIKQDELDGYPCIFPLCDADRCVQARARKAAAE